MKTVCHDRFDLKSLFNKKVTGGFDGGKISSDGGCLLLRELDHRYNVTENMVQALEEKRTPGRVRHDMLTLLKQRTYGIALGYEDAPTITIHSGMTQR